MNPSRRESELRYMDDNEQFDDWLNRCCAKIAKGAPLSICWKNYILRRSTFIDWLMLSPHRAVQVANALSVAQVARWEKAAATRKRNRANWEEFGRQKADIDPKNGADR